METLQEKILKQKEWQENHPLQGKVVKLKSYAILGKKKVMEVIIVGRNLLGNDPSYFVKPKNSKSNKSWLMYLSQFEI